MAERVSFQELKQSVSMADVLAHYGLLESLRPQRKGEELVGLCPFHQETRGSFNVSTTKNAWNCFGCHRHGNILDFVSAKENVEIRRAAMIIQEWFPSGVAFPAASHSEATGPRQGRHNNRAVSQHLLARKIRL